MLVRFDRILSNTWLYPRYIGIVYIRPAMQRASGYAQGMLLDLGCGLKRYEDIFASRVTRYIGLDWPQLVERARPDIVGDALRIPLANISVDTVLATELMEHLPSPDQFLDEVARVLRVRGVLILSVPFMEPLHEEPRDYYRFTPYSLRLLLEQHGFVVAYLEAKGGWWSVVLGSFVNQSFYDWGNPMDRQGRRRNNPFIMALVLPLCALAQVVGYGLDRIFKTTRYTLGYVVVATRVNQS